MNTGEIISLIIIVLVIGISVGYIIWAKLKGKKCIGCPDASSCSHKGLTCGGNCSSCSGCSERCGEKNK